VITAGITVALRHLAQTAALAPLGLVLSGCASNEGAYSPDAVAFNSPAPQVVGPLEAYPLAEKFVAEHPGTDFVVGSGESMQPLYRDHTVLITKRIPISELKPGMTVVYVGASGFSVAHVLVRNTPDGWIAMGVGNARSDAQRVRDDNYVAVVVDAYEPTSSPMLALIKDSTPRFKGSLVASNP
jgi:hypothetical protein